MIEVPVTVKDALREGNLKKNYRITVYKNCTLVDSGLLTNKFTASYSQAFFFLIDGTTRFSNWSYTLYNTDDTVADTVTIPSSSDEQTYVTISMTVGQYVYFDISENTTIYMSIGDYYDQTPLFTIDNDNLVKESVKLDERLCSGDTLKFGLCEGSSIEFQYFGLENITGRRLYVDVEVQFQNTPDMQLWHSIPIGWFTVAETSRQASTGIMKVTAYNKLKSEYLDASLSAELNQIVEQGEDGVQSISLYKLLEKLLNGYAIERYNVVSAEVTGEYTYSVYAEGIPLYNSDGTSKGAFMNIKYGVFGFYINPNSEDYYDYCIYRYLAIMKTTLLSMLQSAYSSTSYGTTYVKVYDASLPVGEMQTVTFESAVNNLYPIMRSASYTDYPYGYVGSSDKFILQFDGNYDTEPHLPARSNCWVRIPYSITFAGSESTSASVADFKTYLLSKFGTDAPTLFNVYKLDVSEMAKIQITIEQAQSMAQSNVTLRDIQTSIYESECEFGKLDRETDLFSGITLSGSALYPAEDLYPANSLYPQGGAERGNFSMYGKLWADEGNIRKFRYLNITYKGTEDDGQGNITEVEKIYTVTVNEDGTDDYNCTSNWLFKNFVWTDEVIAGYATSMAEKMQNISWFPFEMWCAGLPYIETGDEIQIELPPLSYRSYVLRRSMNGIHNLQDDLINGTLDIF